MRSTLTLAAVLAALALVGCTPGPRVQVLPEALPTVSSEVKQTTITAPTPTRASVTRVAALSAYKCRPATSDEIAEVKVYVRGTVTKAVAVDVGEGWVITAFAIPDSTISEWYKKPTILTNGTNYTFMEREFVFRGIVFEGGAAARDAALKCLA